MKKIKLLFIPLALVTLILCLSACAFLPNILKGTGECDHDWYEAYIHESTCQDPGYVLMKCNRCYQTREETLPPANHNELRINKEATCYEGGWIDRIICERCDMIISEGQYIPETKHANTELQNATEATCTSNGYTGDTVCVDCGETLSGGQTVYATEHNLETIPGYEETCTQDGLSDGLVCKDCQYVYQEQRVIPAGHRIEYEWAVEPFCNTPGRTEGQWCSRCQTYLVEPEEIPALPHSEYVSQEGYAPTCTEQGRTDEISCNRCNNVIVEGQWLDPAHTPETIPAVNATCSSVGYTEGSKCSECEEIITAPQLVQKLKHSNTIDLKGYDATCRTSGITDGKACADCGAPIVTQHTIPAQGHVFGDDGQCAGCDLAVTDGLDYVQKNSEVYYVTGFKDGYGDGVSQLVIPPTYDEMPVRGIEDNAFAGNTAIKSVILSENTINIGNNSFTGCSLDYVEVKDVAQYEQLFSQSWITRCEIGEIRTSTSDGLTPYQIFLKAMNAISHNLTRYQLTSEGATFLTYGGASQKAVSNKIIQKQYNNNFYVYQTQTDYMRSPAVTSTNSFYYVDNYLYIPNSSGNAKAYCSPEAFSALFLTESGDIPELTEKYFKGASFVIKDGQMYLTLEMDEELIGDLILNIVGISADMNVHGCTYSYTFDMDGNIISYTSEMDYTLNSIPQYIWTANSTTTFENVGTLPQITAPTGYTDVSSNLSNQCRYGHRVVECEAVPATCFAYGKTAFSYCERCYAAIERYTTIAPSHNYEKGECTDCGHFEDDYVSMGLAYRLNNDGTGYILVGIGDFKGNIVYVPEQVYGLPVLSVNADAFEGTKVEQVVIGGMRWNINGFNGCNDTTVYWQ